MRRKLSYLWVKLKWHESIIAFFVNKRIVLFMDCRRRNFVCFWVLRNVVRWLILVEITVRFLRTLEKRTKQFWRSENNKKFYKIDFYGRIGNEPLEWLKSSVQRDFKVPLISSDLPSHLPHPQNWIFIVNSSRKPTKNISSGL